MRIRHIVWKELWHRKFGALIILIGIVLCITVIVTIQRISLGSIDEVRRAMLVMGKNLVILPKGVTLDQYWASDFSDKTNTLPQEKVKDLADYFSKSKILARHFQGSLQRKVRINGEEVILSGIMVEIDPVAPEAVTKDAERPPGPGKAELGHRAAERLGLEKGGQFSVGGRTFTVTTVRKETGTVLDFRAFVDIKAAQDMFNAAGRVNVIEAVSCMCAPSSLPMLAKNIERQLFDEKNNQPGATAHHFLGIVNARLEARGATMRDANLLSAVMFVFGAILIGGYAVLNAHERRREMGILLAIAARPRHVALLVLQKMFVLGLAGGLIGCWLGDLLLRYHGTRIVARLHPAMRSYIFYLTGWKVYGLAVGLALVLTIVPSLIGVLIASTTDPAETLREL